jgi:quinol monooxygenase YgiN
MLLDRSARCRETTRGYVTEVDADVGPAPGRRSVIISPHPTSLKPQATDELQGIARFKIDEGRLEEFQRLSAECLEIVRRKDTGTLQYEIYFNDDRTEYIVLERYRDSQALMEHFANVGDRMQAIVATGSVSGELLGAVSPELAAQMAGTGVTLFYPYLSM